MYESWKTPININNWRRGREGFQADGFLLPFLLPSFIPLLFHSQSTADPPGGMGGGWFQPPLPDKSIIDCREQSLAMRSPDMGPKIKNMKYIFRNDKYTLYERVLDISKYLFRNVNLYRTYYNYGIYKTLVSQCSIVFMFHIKMFSIAVMLSGFETIWKIPNFRGSWFTWVTWHMGSFFVTSCYLCDPLLRVKYFRVIVFFQIKRCPKCWGGREVSQLFRFYFFLTFIT